MKDTRLLEEMGLSQNEAKCFLALLKKSPMTGYEVAKTAGVTRTMVYDVLKRLERKKCLKVIEGNPKKYVAVNYKDFVRSARDAYSEKIDALEKQLDSLTNASDRENFVFNLSGKAEMIMAFKKAIDCSNDEIYLSTWSQEAGLISEQLKAAFQRGVKLYIFSFCKLPFDFGIQYTYDLEDAHRKFPNRRITGVFDRRVLIMGEGNENIEEIGISTENPMLMEMAIDQMLMDLILHRTLKHFGYLKGVTRVSGYAQEMDRFFNEIKMYADIPKRLDQ
jgi:sugar-specific transcriptional regulator TrmB